MSGPLTPTLRERITPFRVVATLLAALVVTFVILLKISSGDYLLLPDVAHPVTPLVKVEGAKPAKGGQLFFVDVQEQQASLFDELFQGLLYPHSARIPAKVLFPPGTNNAQYFHLGLEEMKASKQIASVVAERHLGYDVVFKSLVRVYKIDPKSHAQGVLDKGDVILATDGTPTPTPDSLRAVISKLKPGTVVSLTIRRDKKTQTVHVKTSSDKGRTVVGVLVLQATNVVLPVKVNIDSGNIGGPSAGLAFTLEVLRQLGENVTHGYKVAATGEMNLNGKVSPIGGVEQKTWGVREAGAQVFLVPAGANYRDAKKAAGPDLKVIPVTSLDDALQKLAALPPAS